MGPSIIRRELDMCLDCQIHLMGPSIIRRELDMCLDSNTFDGAIYY